MEWQGGGRLSAEKTRVGWPEEPHLRGVLVVGFRRSANTHGNARCIPVFWVWSDLADESEGEGCRSPEGSDFAAEEGCEEGDSNAEEGHEKVWGEVQEALSTMGHEDYDETAFSARSQASRSSSSSSSRASVRS